MKFDFEKMKKLYEESPHEFEKVREELIAQYIDSLPSDVRKCRIRGEQFKIDACLDKHKDPINRMNKMVELFWKGFGEFNDAVHGRIKKPKKSETSRVIPVNFTQKGKEI